MINEDESSLEHIYTLRTDLLQILVRASRQRFLSVVVVRMSRTRKHVAGQLCVGEGQ